MAEQLISKVYCRPGESAGRKDNVNDFCRRRYEQVIDEPNPNPTTSPTATSSEYTIPLDESLTNDLLHMLRSEEAEKQIWKENVRQGVDSNGYAVLKLPHCLGAEQRLRGRVFLLCEKILRKALALAGKKGEKVEGDERILGDSESRRSTSPGSSPGSGTPVSLKDTPDISRSSSCSPVVEVDAEDGCEAEGMSSSSSSRALALSTPSSVIPSSPNDAEFIFTAIALTKNFKGSPHIDQNDRGPQYVFSIGSYKPIGVDVVGKKSGGSILRGALCVESEDCCTVHIVPTKNRLAKVDGRYPHWVSYWGGNTTSAGEVEAEDRYSVVFYRSTGEVDPLGKALLTP
ncbi:unnamed protein product [Amoebophrya sp. A25]|nr:unnamed protein product [Amoebophrya sp. A25]|eukprot:GSA25T00003838001.1